MILNNKSRMFQYGYSKNEYAVRALFRNQLKIKQ